MLVAVIGVSLAAGGAAPSGGQPPQGRAEARQTLDIYFIDVEGGQSTLIVTPAGESLLIDTGYAGDGTFQSKAGDPARARDAQRIAAAARDAGVTRIDYLLITHFHADHDGGVVELAQLLPIGTFIDHGGVLPGAEARVAGYARCLRCVCRRAREGPSHGTKARRPPSAARRDGCCGQLRGGDDSAAARWFTPPKRPGRGGGRGKSGMRAGGAARRRNRPKTRARPACVCEFGRFRFLDLGDLSGAPLFALACPRDLVGPVDVYLVRTTAAPTPPTRRRSPRSSRA